MITRRAFAAGVTLAAAAESASAGCGSRRSPPVVLTGRISAIGAGSMDLELGRGIRTILFGDRFHPAGFNTGDYVSVTCRVNADGDLVAERSVRSGAQGEPGPGATQPSGHRH